MTDVEALFRYRLKEARETLVDAERMLAGDFALRSVVNRAYYAMFYALLALFLRNEIRLKTSKHQGVISSFDREFVQPGRVETRHSKALHRVFELRQQGDYREFSDISREKATTAVDEARDFIAAVDALIE